MPNVAHAKPSAGRESEFETVPGGSAENAAGRNQRHQWEWPVEQLAPLRRDVEIDIGVHHLTGVLHGVSHDSPPTSYEVVH